MKVNNPVQVYKKKKGIITTVKPTYSVSLILGRDCNGVIDMFKSYYERKISYEN